jgi:aspartate aminotransferase
MGKLNIHFDEIQAPAAIAIADKVRALKAQGVQIAAMQTGEPCFATPDYIKHAAIEALAQNQTKYCESLGLPVLRNALSNYYSEHFNHSFSASQFFISPGASYSIYSILNAILNVGDEVIIPDPSWPQYHNISVLCGANPIHVSTRTTGFKITVEALERLVSSNTKVLILNNPNNPTGVVYSKEELEWIIEFAASKSMYVLVDEVYDHIVYSSNFNKSFSLNLTEKQRESILYVNSFSKTFAMTGWRIAYSY